MNTLKSHRLSAKIGFLVLMSLAQFAPAQYFNSNPGDMLLGFRKTGGNEGSTYELVVDGPNITNLLAVPMGTTINITNYSTGVLSFAFPGSAPTAYGNLQWSVFSATPSTGNLTNSYGVFPSSTLWYTSPDSSTNTQTATPNRFSHANQSTVSGKVQQVANGATSISSALSVTNADNNSNLVAEATSNDGTGTTLTDGVRGVSDVTIATFGDIIPNVENETPSSFTAAQRNDLYQSVSSSSHSSGTFVDPITGTTNGACYFVGYFLLNPNGTMTFTRATSSAPPPPAPFISVHRTNTTSTISFNTTNGATYNLIYTTLSGITTPRSSWTVLGGSITGAGGSTNFTDTTTDPGRVYSVTAH